MFALIAAVAPLKFKEYIETLTENPSLDRVHAISLGLGLLPSPKQPVTMIRIDDRTFDAWERPFPIRRAKIAKLVLKARQAGAAAILVDLDISAKTDTKDKAALDAVLSAWGASGPPLLFPRELKIDENNKTRQPEASGYDELFTGENSLHWVNVLFEQDGDTKIRNWNLWEVPSNTCTAFLSPPLLAFALTNGGETQVKYVEHYVTARENPDCAKPLQAAVGGPPSWLVELEKNAPIQFTFPQSEAAASREVVQGTDSPAFIQLSAIQFESRSVAASAIAGRFVIIGNSYADNGDYHDTPAGEMEGMRVIANAVANGPNAIEANPDWRWYATILLSMLLGGSVAMLTFKLKPLAAAPIAFVAAIGIYSFCNREWGPVAAHDVIRNSIIIWVLAIAFESGESILIAIMDGRGWRSFANDEEAS